MRWRRLCIDVDDDGRCLGGSVEFYSDRKVDPETVAVLGRSAWSGRTPSELLDAELALGWFQEALPFVMVPQPPSG